MIVGETSDRLCLRAYIGVVFEVVGCHDIKVGTVGYCLILIKYSGDCSAVSVVTPAQANLNTEVTWNLS